MYHLFYTLESSAMCCHAALEEAGAAYELHDVDLLSPLSAEYLALNPNGKVPTLIHERDDGERLVLFQSGGILLYLADCHPEANLAPPPGSSGRGLCYQWLHFLGEMVQQSYMMSYYSDRFTSASQGTAAVDEKGREWVAKLLGQVDSALESGPYFLGEQFSVCDLYLHTLSRWRPGDRSPFDGFANLASCAALVNERPAVQRMMAVHCAEIV
ncbi:MAG: glutathione S-transferase family protein [Pseudomonadota bacterium]|nr:glutathione S-transferase family protein [Pseudomonadota bacterium]